MIKIVLLCVFFISHTCGADYERKDIPNACEVQAFRVEQKHSIPHGLMSAITLVESGRRRQGASLQAWPWAVQSQGQAYYFSSKEAAIAAVRRLIHRGIRNIDVGCAQVNLGHHPHAFRDLQEAFDPHANITYAAEFLKRLLKKTGSWHHAVAHYHSAHADHHIPYRNKVYKAWYREKKKQHPSVLAEYLTTQERMLSSSKRNSTLGMGSWSPVQKRIPSVQPSRVISQYLSHVPSLSPQKLLWNAGLQHPRKTYPLSYKRLSSRTDLSRTRQPLPSTYIKQPLPLSLRSKT